jgi:hypothetical protein
VLLARRQKLPATSNQMPELDIEILAVWNLVKSYRLLQAHTFQGKRLSLQRRHASIRCLALLPGTLRLEMLEAKRKSRGEPALNEADGPSNERPPALTASLTLLIALESDFGPASKIITASHGGWTAIAAHPA